MKQAKQQSQDLRQTDDFLRTAFKTGGVEKEKAKHSPLDNNSLHRQMNGRPKMPRVDSFSRFSEPPAPPPQQPLPEKPDALPRTGTDAFSALKRSDTEKAKPPACSSPVSRDSSQILSLIEALSSAKREIDSQGTRVKELENLLRQERSAREWAEERARKLELQSGNDKKQVEVEAALKSPPEKEQDSAAEQPILKKSLESDGAAMSLVDASTADLEQADSTMDSHTKQLERRLQMLMDEMEEMRQQVAAFKQRAQEEEAEKLEARKSLAEMIETLRRERAQNSEASLTRAMADGEDLVETGDVVTPSSKEDVTKSEAHDSVMQRRRSVTSSHTKEIEQNATALTKQCQEHSFLEQSGPYASMLGVVLLGVGLMAYLNGWQKLDK